MPASPWLLSASPLCRIGGVCVAYPCRITSDGIEPRDDVSTTNFAFGDAGLKCEGTSCCLLSYGQNEQGCLPPISNQRPIVRSALSLAIVVTLVIVGLSLYAHRFHYEAQTEPDVTAVPFLLRVDRVTGKVQRYDYRNAK